VNWDDARAYCGWAGGWTSPSRDPSGPATGEMRTLRGASWGGTERDGRVLDRLKALPAFVGDRYGFRCGGDVFGP
jgi:formylglycine-generating enzyme required for sulfatase activity